MKKWQKERMERATQVHSSNMLHNFYCQALFFWLSGGTGAHSTTKAQKRLENAKNIKKYNKKYIKSKGGK